jgi:hypothetical protein
MHTQSGLASVRKVIALPGAFLNDNPSAAAIIWVVLAAVLFYLDLVTARTIQFPVLFLIPVAGAAWYNGRQLALTLVLVLCVARLMHDLYFFGNANLTVLLVNNLMYTLAGVVFATMIDMLARRTMVLSDETKALETENIQLATVEETMLTVNDLVLNRMMIVYAYMDFMEQGGTLTPTQLQRMRVASEEIVANLRALGKMERYETKEVAGGRRAVNYNFVPKRDAQ